MKRRRQFGSWIPLWFTKMCGFLDAKGGAVGIDESGGKGQFLERVTASCNVCVHLLYTDLEREAAKMHTESAQLSLEYAGILEELNASDEVPNGVTASMRIRDAKRIAAVKPKLRTRKQEIECRLAVIEEELCGASNEAAAISRQAVSLTARRVHAYLHGACVAMRMAAGESRYEIRYDFDDAQEYNERHAVNDGVRRQILAAALKGVESHEG